MFPSTVARTPITGRFGPSRVFAPRLCDPFPRAVTTPRARRVGVDPLFQKVLNLFIVSVFLPISLCSPVVLKNQD